MYKHYPNYDQNDIDNWVNKFCGTVHTFQGKKANEVVILHIKLCVEVLFDSSPYCRGAIYPILPCNLLLSSFFMRGKLF